MAAWSVLLEDTERSRAISCIRSIARRLEHVSPAALPPDLAAGSAGIALFWAYAGHVLDEDECGDHAVRWLDDAIERISETHGLGLFQGALGVAWVLEHLFGAPRSEQGAALEDNEATDAALLEPLSISPFAGHFDLVRGLVGAGVYTLERIEAPSARRCLEAIVNRLGEIAQRSESPALRSEPAFLSAEQRAAAPDGHYDLGVAHGNPGVAYVLAAALHHGVHPCRTRAQLDALLPWIFQQMGPPGVRGRLAYFVPNRGQGPARLAWCYGDAGVAMALHTAGRLRHREDWCERARMLGDEAATRRLEHSEVSDPWLCHGSAGVGHVLNRLFHATGSEDCKTGARTWLIRAVEHLEHADGDLPLGFLTGLAGAGLALAAAVGDVEPQWDRVLLLSIRAHPAADE